MSDTSVIVIAPDVEQEPAAPVVVVEPEPSPDPLLDIVTRLTRVEDAVTILGSQVATIDQRTTIVEVETEQVAETVEAVAELAITTAIATEEAIEQEPEPEPVKESDADEPPKSKVHRWWK